MPKRLPATVQTVGIDPDQLAELARLIGREVAGFTGSRPADRSEGSRLLSTPEAAEYLSVSHNTLRTWRWDGKGPRYVKIGNAVRYRVDALEKFLRDNTRATDGTR